MARLPEGDRRRPLLLRAQLHPAELFPGQREGFFEYHASTIASAAARNTSFFVFVSRLPICLLTSFALLQSSVSSISFPSFLCEKYDIKMGIHPDDPAWPIFGLPRIMTGKDSVTRLLDAVDKPYNGITLCTGSFGSNQNNDLCEIIKACRGRIPFAHVRNLKYNSPRDFEEAAHLSSDGSIDMYKIMKTLYDTGFDGVIRPDHGRMIWDEVAMPGYGLYDRALGATYLNGLWEAIDKSAK